MEIFHAFLSSADFCQDQCFRKILSGIHSDCQTVGSRSDPSFLSSLIWIQTVCKGYQQMTLGGKELTLFIQDTSNSGYHQTSTLANSEGPDETSDIK